MNRKMLRLLTVVCLALAAGGAGLKAEAANSKAPTRPDALEAALQAPPPFVPLAPRGTPAPWPLATIVPTAKGSWLPPAEIRPELRLVAAADPPALRSRRAADLPPLADVAGPPAPAGRKLDVPPLAAAPAPNINVLPILPLRPWNPLERMGAFADPTQQQSRDAVVAAEPPYRHHLAPFVKLTLPDPFELVNEIRLLRPPADNEPPVSMNALPAKPPLRTKP